MCHLAKRKTNCHDAHGAHIHLTDLAMAVNLSGLDTYLRQLDGKSISGFVSTNVIVEITV
jgi:hypothetical protein